MGRQATLLAVVVLLTLMGAAGWQVAEPVQAQPSPVQPQAEVAERAGQAVNTVPPAPQGLSIYVTDQAGLLTLDDQATLRERLQALDQAGLAQVAVLVLPDTDRELSEFAPEIMKRWGVQHRGRHDGLLVLVNARRVRENRSGNRIFAAPGGALEGLLPDALLGRILDEKALPAFKAGQPSRGVTEATLAMAQIIAGDQTLRAKYAQPSAPRVHWVSVLLLVGLALLVFRRLRRFGGGSWVIGDSYGGGFGGGFSSGDGGGGFSGGFGGGDDSSSGGGAGR